MLEDYTEEERFLITTLPPMIGAVVSASDKSGIIGTVKEAMASFGAAKDIAASGGTSNPLIEASLLAGVPEGDKKAAMEAAKANREKLLERMKEKGIQSPEEMADQLLEDCGVVGAALSKAIPNHADEYRDWALSIGQRVAAAAKEGGIIGMGKGSVSEKEQALLDKIRTALG